MRVFIAVLVLIFSFQSWTKADDISDFEIEGMSVGDSLLDYFSEEEINNFDKVQLYNKRYTDIVVVKNLSTYDKLMIGFLTKDPKKIIARVDGIIKYEHNIAECYDKIKEIYKEVLSVVNDLNDLGLETYQMRGTKGTITDYVLESKNEDEIQIACYDYYNKEFTDELRLGIRTIDYRNFLRNEAYN
jgi:hypothetical protein